MFAFRQDPNYWTFENVIVTAQGSSVNLIVNGNFLTGGTVLVTSLSPPVSVSVPTAWGVTYQNGYYPVAAGTWIQVIRSMQATDDLLAIRP
jgi:fibronectin-binding autotransporter adhesin